ncbi:MAG: cyclodeaminase/cyclohydrolase family protein [Planctomycetes bacterium]|nr:cyclodeaminase/cyclohydrolase family protein [Planctomycetota bacterium]
MDSFTKLPVQDFLRVAASDAPTPGGGAIAALVGALGASMASMAGNFTVGRPKYQEHDALVKDTLSELSDLTADMLRAVDDDAEAFSGISLAYKLPKGTDEEKAARKTAVDDALTASMQVPLRVVRCAVQAARLLPPLARVGNPNLLSDVVVAAIMLEAAARAGRANVRANSGQLHTEAARQAEAEADAASRETADLCRSVEEIVAGR